MREPLSQGSPQNTHMRMAESGMGRALGRAQPNCYRKIRGSRRLPRKKMDAQHRVGPGFSERAWAVDRLLVARRKLFSIPKASTGTEDRGVGSKAGVSISHLSTFPTV